MINRLVATPNIPDDVMTGIDELKPWVGGSWDLKVQAIDDFKRVIKEQLLTIQNDKCAYCGLPLDETGKTEIEHFAPKGGEKRPKHIEFTFTVENLVLSCNLCNSPIKKGTYDTISTKNQDYRKCTFKIVHPYFDDHALHYQWPIDEKHVLIQGISEKGLESIRIFKLASISHTEARTRLKIKAYLDNIPDGPEIIARALAYRE